MSDTGSGWMYDSERIYLPSDAAQVTYALVLATMFWKITNHTLAIAQCAVLYTCVCTHSMSSRSCSMLTRTRPWPAWQLQTGTKGTSQWKDRHGLLHVALRSAAAKRCTVQDTDDGFVTRQSLVQSRALQCLLSREERDRPPLTAS